MPTVCSQYSLFKNLMSTKISELKLTITRRLMVNVGNLIYAVSGKSATIFLLLCQILSDFKNFFSLLDLIFFVQSSNKMSHFTSVHRYATL